MLPRVLAGALWNDGLSLALDGVFERKRDKYDDLIDIVVKHGFDQTATTFVSLNYDLLLEETLRRRNSEPKASFGREYLVADWAVHKPHGSVDWWAAGSTLGSGSEWAELSQRGMEFQEVFRGNVPPHLMKGNPGWPVIAH